MMSSHGATFILFLFLLNLSFAALLWVHLTLGLRVEHFFFVLFWPLQCWTAFYNLLKLALGSFVFHGRNRPWFLLNLFEIAELFRLKYWTDYPEEFAWVNPRWTRIYDWWIGMQNPVLFDTLLTDQDATAYFRWGALVRYGYIVFLGFRATFFTRVLRWVRRFLGSPFGYTWAVFILYFLRWLGVVFGAPIWALLRGFRRFVSILGSEGNFSILVRVFGLDRAFGYQWFQQGNTDDEGSPETIYDRMHSRAFLGNLWFFWQTQVHRRRFAMAAFTGQFSNLLALVIFSLLLLPLGILSIFSLTILTFSLLVYHRILRRSVDALVTVPLSKACSLFQTVPWVIFQGLSMIILSLWWLPYGFCQFLWVGGRWLRRLSGILIIGSLYFVVNHYNLTSFFDYSLSRIIWEVLVNVGSLSTAFLGPGPLSFQLIAPFGDPMPWRGDQNIWVKDCYEDLWDWGGASHYGPQFRGIALRRTAPFTTPGILLYWRPENWHQWITLSTYIAAYLPDDIRKHPLEYYGDRVRWFYYQFVADFHAARYELVRWYGLWGSWFTIKQYLWRVPFNGIIYRYRLMSCRFWYRFWGREGCIRLWLILAAFGDRPLAWFFLWPVFLRRLSITWPLRITLNLLLLFSHLGRFSQALIFGLLLLLRLPAYLAAWFVVGLYRALVMVLSALASLGAFIFRFLASVSWVYLPFTVWSLLGEPLQTFIQGLWIAKWRWYVWWVSTVLSDFLSWSFWSEFSRNAGSALPTLFLTTAANCWSDCYIFAPGPSPEQRWTMGWSLALSAYLWFQQWIDRICVYLQVPRHWDNYVLFQKIRLMRHTVVWKRKRPMTPRPHGALATGHSWLLSPVIVFRYLCAAPDAVFWWMSPHRWSPFHGELSPTVLMPDSIRDTFVSDVADFCFGYLPIALTDAHRFYVSLTPFLYYGPLLVMIAVVPGFWTLLAGHTSQFTPVLNRQEAWLQCRGQPTKTMQSLIYFPWVIALDHAKVEFANLLDPRCRWIFRRFYQDELKALGYLPTTTLERSLLESRCLGRGMSWLVKQSEEDLRVVALPFAKFLLKPRYNNLRFLLEENAPYFITFLAYFYKRHPSVPLCWSDYDDDDYLAVGSDVDPYVSDLVIREIADFRSLLDSADRHFFETPAGPWLWSKDQGNFDVQCTMDAELYGNIAYEVDDQYRDGWQPFSLYAWFVCVPMSLLAGAYYQLEIGWNMYPYLQGGGTQEIQLQLVMYQNLAGHFYCFHDWLDVLGWYVHSDFFMPNHPTTQKTEFPTDGYMSWDEDPYQATYFVPIRAPYMDGRWLFYWGPGFYWGPSRGTGILLEVMVARWSLLALALVILIFFGRSLFGKAVATFTFRQSSASPGGVRPSTLYAERRLAKQIYLWFWK